MSRTLPLAPAKRPSSSRRGERDELGRDRVAVAVEQVDPAAQLAVLRAVVAEAGGPVDLGDLARRLVDERAEVLAEQLLGPPAGQPLGTCRRRT